MISFLMKLPAAADSAEVATSATKAGSCGVSCEILRPVGQSLWAACRSHYPPSPRLRRVLLAFIPAAAYSAEAAASAAKAGSYGVFGEGESNSGVPTELFHRLLGRLQLCSRNAYVLTRPPPVLHDALMMRCKVKQ